MTQPDPTPVAGEPPDDRMAKVLVDHQRKDSGSCLCGWSQWGASHAEHQWQMLKIAGAEAASPAALDVRAMGDHWFGTTKGRWVPEGEACCSLAAQVIHVQGQGGKVHIGLGERCEDNVSSVEPDGTEAGALANILDEAKGGGWKPEDGTSLWFYNEAGDQMRLDGDDVVLLLNSALSGAAPRAEGLQRLDTALDALDAAMDAHHPEGCGCDLCNAATDVRLALDAIAVSEAYEAAAPRAEGLDWRAAARDYYRFARHGGKCAVGSTPTAECDCGLAELDERWRGPLASRPSDERVPESEEPR